ncbi:hypothetical protein [Psychrobacillus sp. NEAU-3TGS]|nr:hypothetical protein [Psychrobacillus sp. NEAU-3TGS]
MLPKLILIALTDALLQEGVKLFYIRAAGLLNNLALMVGSMNSLNNIEIF